MSIRQADIIIFPCLNPKTRKPWVIIISIPFEQAKQTDSLVVVERADIWTLEELAAITHSGHIANLVLHTDTIPCNLGCVVLPACWVNVVILCWLSEAWGLWALVQGYQSCHHAISHILSPV